ncbi:mechanosensory transduction mediator [Cricetulus griseus]
MPNAIKINDLFQLTWPPAGQSTSSQGGSIEKGGGGGWSRLHSPHPQKEGTFVSAFTVLCGARTDLPDRHVCCVFWLNIAAALIQVLTAIVMVGWIMSIFWGMDMVILASEVQGSRYPTAAVSLQDLPEKSKVL